MDHATAEATPQPLVGVGVLILRDGRVLLGQRIGSHGAGSWALPGGHLEFGETPVDCALREVREETGLALDPRQLLPGPYVNDVFSAEGKHYVTLFVIARHAHGEAALMEPGKCLGWRWFGWHELPAPLFQPLETLRRSGFVPDAMCGA